MTSVVDKFCFNKASKIILYGAAYLGKLFFDTLSSQGFQIEAFVDARANEISKMKGRPVYSLDELSKQYNGENIIIVVAVKNVFEHSKIASSLVEKGFNKIVYKPYEVIKGKGSLEQERISDLFDVIQDNKIITETYVDVTQRKPYLSTSSKYLISEDDTEVIVYLPTNCIFQDRIKDNDIADICSLYLYPHIQFFEFLQGKLDAKPSAYIEYCRNAARRVGDFETTQLWEQNVVRNRTLIFEEMSNSFLIDREFFVRSAPKVEWNKQGYFNLNSGKHRTTFLISKGVTSIPVRMSKKDYECWVNKDCAELSFNKIAEEVHELIAPIEHPYFYEYPCAGRSFFENLVYQMAKQFCALWYTSPNINFMHNKKFYIDVKDNGYLSRHFRRLGCCVYNANKGDYSDILETLFGIENKEEKNASCNIDVVVIELDSIEKFYEEKNKLFAQHWIIISQDTRYKEMGQYIAGGACNGLSTNVYYLENVE